MTLNLPPCPQSLKAIQHYLKTATEHEARDPVVTYWCRLYALQGALKIDKKSEDARKLLVALMDWLEKQKKSLTENDAITNEVAASAHIENYAIKLFTWADSQDRAGIFNKNVVKAFYTAGMLMDVLTTFGEHTEEIARNCKYAKWKAAYIHNCLRNGETPVPGPMETDENGDFHQGDGSTTNANNIGFQMPPGENSSMGGPPANTPDFSPSTGFMPNAGVAPPTPAPRPDLFVPAQPPPPDVTPSMDFQPYYPTQSDISPVSSTAKLEPAIIAKAQKYCKFAGSALNYDDIPEAINNLEKALKLLRTGQDV